MYTPSALRKCGRRCEYLPQKSAVACATPSRQLEMRLRRFADSTGWLPLLPSAADVAFVDEYDEEYLTSKSLHSCASHDCLLYGRIQMHASINIPMYLQMTLYLVLMKTEVWVCGPSFISGVGQLLLLRQQQHSSSSSSSVES